MIDMMSKKLKPITSVPALVVESIDSFEQEMSKKQASPKNKKFLSECRSIYQKHRF